MLRDRFLGACFCGHKILGLGLRIVTHGWNKTILGWYMGR